MDKSIKYGVYIRLIGTALCSLSLLLLSSSIRVEIILAFFLVSYSFWELHYQILLRLYRTALRTKPFLNAFSLAVISVVIYSFISVFSFLGGVQGNHFTVLFLLFLLMAGITVLHILLISVRHLDYALYRELREKKLVLEHHYKAIKSKSILSFLQNSLEATQKLIAIDPEKAEEQIEKLTLLLRSLLQSRDKDYISLREESDLVKDFVKLLELQGNVKIVFSIEEDSEYQEYMIPPFVLILIFDNIFENRSFIPYAELQVYVENGLYLVAKYKQLRKNVPAQKQDDLLKNLKQRYFFSNQDKNIVLINTQSHTYIKVPLLHQEKLSE